MNKSKKIVSIALVTLLTGMGNHRVQGQILNQQPLVASQMFFVGTWTGNPTGEQVHKSAVPGEGIYAVRLAANGGMMPLALTPSDSAG